jgi:predicted unusual protein kinase regulating ubiquinone biosynthesis (AarF/ABC1/UbiB family)
VAVKVQRPNLKKLFDMDLTVVKSIAWLLDWVYANVEGISCNWGEIFNEYCRIMYKEIDYRLEGLNAIKFKNNFAAYPWIRVPKVIEYVIIIKTLWDLLFMLICSRAN